MKIPNSILSLSVVLFVTGCATSYQSSGPTGGYGDTQLAPDAFRVVFSGNAYSTDEQAQDYALLRASQVTIQHGFTCFAITSEKYAMHSDPAHHTIVLFYQPKEELAIRCYKTRPDAPFTYDAAFLQQSMKKKYHMK